MIEPSELYRAMARIICAQLIPHRTSVHNVSLLAEALTAAEEKGRREAIEECARIVRDVKAEAAVDAPCVVAGAWRLACAEIDQRIRALADQPAAAAPVGSPSHPPIEEILSCPECGLRWEPVRVDEEKPDGSFGPGPLVRCVGCKATFHCPVPAAPPEPSEAEWLRRLLRWCRPRLKHPSYQSWLDKYLAAGPSEAPKDEPPIVQSDVPPQPSEAEVEDAVDAGIEAAAEAVSALPPGQKGWDQKEFMIAETAAKAALAAAKVRAR